MNSIVDNSKKTSKLHKDWRDMYELSLISTFVVMVVVNLSLSLSLLQMAFEMLQKVLVIRYGSNLLEIITSELVGSS